MSGLELKPPEIEQANRGFTEWPRAQQNHRPLYNCLASAAKGKWQGDPINAG